MSDLLKKFMAAEATGARYPFLNEAGQHTVKLLDFANVKDENIFVTIEIVKSTSDLEVGTKRKLGFNLKDKWDIGLRNLKAFALACIEGRGLLERYASMGEDEQAQVLGSFLNEEDANKNWAGMNLQIDAFSKEKQNTPGEFYTSLTYGPAAE